MRPASLPLPQEVAFSDEFLQSQLHGAGFAFCERHDLAEGEGFVIGEEGDNLSELSDCRDKTKPRKQVLGS